MQLKNIYDNGTPKMRSLLSIEDRVRLETILAHEAGDYSDDDLDVPRPRMWPREAQGRKPHACK